MASLLDVSTLIGLVDSSHVGHGAIRKWFMQHYRAGWATCPLTENGMLRILSQAAYSGGKRTPTEVVQILNALKGAFGEFHQFWLDDISIADASVFDSALIAGPRQITDTYLLGLAARHKGTLVSFDRSLTWQAVRGGSERLVQSPG